MILLIDNYDSFVHNLARYFTLLGQETLVVRNDAINASGVLALEPQAVVLSPGPCTPVEAGCSLEVVRELHQAIPMLGVCLGHQTIAAALGGKIVRATEPRHGRTSEITHDGDGLFVGLPSPLTVCRYHSLVVEPDSLPAKLAATAHTAGEVVMAFEHAELPVFGVQFHPEAILTEGGYQLLANFLHAAVIKTSASVADLAAEEDRSPATAPLNFPNRPVTF